MRIGAMLTCSSYYAGTGVVVKGLIQHEFDSTYQSGVIEIERAASSFDYFIILVIEIKRVPTLSS